MRQEITRDLEQLIARDAALCAAMAEDLDDYLKSNELFWEPNRRRPGGPDLPKLTLGGLLLALRRLETLREHLTPDQSHALTRARREMDYQKRQWRTRYQTKLARDLRSRLDAWAWYLDDCKQQGEAVTAHYTRQVETRAKADLLLDEAGEIGLDVAELRQRQVALDERLRADFHSGDFCWAGELAAGFPVDRFWYLYGHPGTE